VTAYTPVPAGGRPGLCSGDLRVTGLPSARLTGMTSRTRTAIWTSVAEERPATSRSSERPRDKASCEGREPQCGRGQDSITRQGFDFEVVGFIIAEGRPTRTERNVWPPRDGPERSSPAPNSLWLLEPAKDLVAAHRGCAVPVAQSRSSCRWACSRRRAATEAAARARRRTGAGNFRLGGRNTGPRGAQDSIRRMGNDRRRDGR